MPLFFAKLSLNATPNFLKCHFYPPNGPQLSRLTGLRCTIPPSLSRDGSGHKRNKLRAALSGELLLRAKLGQRTLTEAILCVVSELVQVLLLCPVPPHCPHVIILRLGASAAAPGVSTRFLLGLPLVLISRGGCITNELRRGVVICGGKATTGVSAREDAQHCVLSHLHRRKRCRVLLAPRGRMPHFVEPTRVEGTKPPCHSSVRGVPQSSQDRQCVFAWHATVHGLPARAAHRTLTSSTLAPQHHSDGHVLGQTESGNHFVGGDTREVHVPDTTQAPATRDAQPPSSSLPQR